MRLFYSVFATSIVAVVILLSLAGCATKVPLEGTCMTCIQSQRINCKSGDCPSTVMANGNCLAVFEETGEKINLNKILEKEEIKPQSNIPLTLAKIRGLYFVIGENFKNMWVLKPCGLDEAKLKKVELPVAGLTTSAPIFEIVDGALVMREDTKGGYVWMYNIDDNKWISNTVKTGE